MATSNWKLSQDGVSASRTLANGGMESRLVHAIDADELVSALPADPVDLATPARSQRDALLAACDWTQCRDITDATVAAWQPYRQSLRDLTKQAGFPTSIVWPVAP
jgi:Phage tail assembly chaperone protein